MKNTNIISMIIMVAACAILASCSFEKENTADVVLGSNAITLSPSVPSTKTYDFDMSYLQGQGFNVVGIYNAPDGTVSNVFDSHPCAVSYVPSSNDRRRQYMYAGDIKYWQANGSYDFAAYANSYNVSMTTTDRMSTVSGQYLISQNQLDLLLAYSHVEMQQSSNDYPVVNLNFRHALSAIKFLIYADEGTEASLDDFYVTNAVTGGTFSIGAGATPAAKNTLNWTVGDPQPGRIYSLTGTISSIPKGESHKMNVQAVGEGYKTLGCGSDTWAGDYMAVIPQTLTNQSLVFTITSGGETVVTTKKLKSSNGKWEAGKKYIYTLKVEGAHIDLILVTTTEWDELTGVAGDDIILTSE